jgi:NADPH:quinone reductase-like Zn-dependent oxidoreductase
MKAAIVPQAGRAPVYGDFNEPAPAAGESRVVITAAALSPVVKARASGTHYSAPGSFPIGVGIDGVGRLDDGSRVHFFLPRALLAAWQKRSWCRLRSAQSCLPAWTI